MDRRVVAGLISLILAGSARSSSGQSVPGRDPSAQPSVGLTPIPSIGDTINNATVLPGPGVPMASSRMPTSPVGQGPAAVIPRAPVLSSPVSIMPIDPIHQSISRGFGTGLIGTLFRRQETPTAEVAPPAFSSIGRLTRSADLVTRKYSPSPALLSDGSGRPAPFAGQSPERPRLQADPSVKPSAGRPAPFTDDQPRSSRPQAPPDSRSPALRPKAESSNAPASLAEAAEPVPIESPPTPPSLPPAEVTPAAAIEAPPVVAPPSPVGSDPLRGIELNPPRTPEATPVPALPALPDPEVKQTSQQSTRDETALRTKPIKPRPLQYATLRAAAVGDQIITINELETAVQEQAREMMAGSQTPMSPEQKKMLLNQIAASVLNHLIDQALILQEAKRKLEKNSKGQQQFNDTVDRVWKTDEVPPLLRKHAAANIFELKAKLTAEGKSYEALKETFRKSLLSSSFLGAEIQNKLTSDLSEQKAYYNAHLDSYVQPTRMTWREIEINVAKHPSRAAARKKVDEILARLLHDEDFDTVAKASSDGPTASKGGLYVDMQPGSYGIPVVNDELNRLPIGQVSQVLEAPNSFHIVRVDSRREKGPLRFDEVQEKIRNQVFKENREKAIAAYLAKLRSKTLIRTMFDETESDPEIARRNDPALQKASSR